MTTHHPNRIPNGRTDSSSDIDVSHALTALPRGGRNRHQRDRRT